MSLEEKYKLRCETKSDINEHLPTLYKYSSECQSVAELGVRGVVSSYAFAWGLKNNNSQVKEFSVFDISYCDVSDLVQDCFENGIDICDHIPEDDLTVNIAGHTYDLTFIDTFHCYPHCYEELCKFSNHTNKYIILHDTTIDSETSECVRLGYEPQHYDNLVDRYSKKYTADDFKKGLSYAIDKFLAENPEWSVKEKFENNNGLTVLSK